MMETASLLCLWPRYSRLPSCGLDKQLTLEMSIKKSIRKQLAILRKIQKTGTDLRLVSPAAVVDSAASCSSWFLPHVSRSKAQEMLAPLTPGSFLLRSSSCPSSAFALSEVSGDKVQHHLLLLGPQGVTLAGSSKVFPCLSSMVTHLSIMKETLPCCLLVKEQGGKEEQGQGDKVDIDKDKEMEECVNNLKRKLEE